MSSPFWIIILIFFVVFILTTLWIIFIYFKNAKKDYNLYKSVSKSVFSRKISLSIIVIFYMISFGLVGGLTSILGRLNAEVTSYIKENHLHQGVINETKYNQSVLEEDTLGQKSFYLATQGVLDFANWQLGNDGDSIKESAFIDMVGGQHLTSYESGKENFAPNNPTIKEIFDGSTSPLSIRANQYNSDNYQTYSVMDIGAFWNAWYDGTFSSDEDWTTYYYNEKEENYADLDKHESSSAISWIEEKINQFIFLPTAGSESWSFDSTIKENKTTFSAIIYGIFDQDLNKYYTLLSTYIVEYYVDLFDQTNQFASSRVFEYQKSFLGTSFLLQSYNKNQVTNENGFLNNPGTDDNGDYSIDTVNFYNHQGKKVKGPDANSSFFKAHDGSKDDPYEIYVSTDYYQVHNLNSEDGKTKKLFNYEGPNNNGLYYQIKGSYNSPTYSFPIQSVSSGFQRPEDNAAILISTQSLLRLTRSPSISTTNYEFFGFSNVYDKTNRASDWYYSEDSNKAYVPAADYPFQVTKYVGIINDFLGDSGWDDDNLSESWGENKPQDFHLVGETLYDKDSLISYRSFMIIQEIYGDQIFFGVIMVIFLLIVIIILILLIRKRINDSNKQIGTIKALGFGSSRIASAYTIYPIVIIILGSILAIIVALPLSLVFASIYGGFYAINLSGVYVGLMFWLKILIIPLLISMFIGYWMAYHTIKKPTLDLLNNVNNDKPNWIVRGTSYLIPPFASFSFTYKSKGIGRAFFKSVLLFFAITASMSITSFAFASSTFTSSMTEEVFDIINYESKIREFDPYFVEDININDDDYHNLESGMIAFDLFSVQELNNNQISKDLIEYVISVFSNPEEALATFQELLISTYPDCNSFDFKFTINSGNKSPTITSNYYIEWKTAVALWATNVALHVPSDGSPNSDLTEPIYADGKNKINFEMLDPLLDDYALNWITNIIARYGAETTFTFIQFFTKIVEDYKEKNILDLKDDFAHIKDFFNKYDNKAIIYYLLEACENEDIFNDIVFNKNYYDGAIKDENGNVIDEQINQTITTSFHSYFLKIDLSGNLILNSNQEEFKTSSSYMEGYTSIEELMVTNDVGPSAEGHIKQSTCNDNIVNVVMNKEEFQDLQDYKEAVPILNEDLSPNQARVLANSIIWNANTNSYEKIYVPIVFEVEVYDSIYPLGAFFLQEDMDAAINNSLDWMSDSENQDEINQEFEGKFNDKTWYSNYDDFINAQFALSQDAFYEPNYLITYNINTKNNKDFHTAPFSVSLEQEEMINLINADKSGEKLPLEILLNNNYISFQIPINIDVIVFRASRVYELLQGILYIIAFFSLFIGITIVMIAMKDIIDSNKREVSMFKAFGYSNLRATFLVITPYIFVIIFAFLISVPAALIFLSVVGTILTAVTGTTYIFVLGLWQWIIVIGFIISLVVFLGFLGYKSYQHTNALEAINETNE